jgi:hypothetical protein
LVIGAIHGDELPSAAVALHWIRLAGQAPADTPQPVHWRFVPVLNPDGAPARPPTPRSTPAAWDLNRNFPTPNWQRDARIYWEKRTGRDPRRWPGPQPLSEPESRFLHEQMRSFNPQLIVSIQRTLRRARFCTGRRLPPSRLGRCAWTRWAFFLAPWGSSGGVPQRACRW